MQAFVTPIPIQRSSWTPSTTVSTLHRRDYGRQSNRRQHASLQMKSNDADVIIIGSGFGGLCAAAMLCAYGKKALVLESHGKPGGVAHGFTRKTKQGLFKFDTGPSFFCGIDKKISYNPLKYALDAIDTRVTCVAYPEFGIYDVKQGMLRVSESTEVTLRSIEAIGGTEAARQMRRFYGVMAKMHSTLTVPPLVLRGDWKVAPVALRRWAKKMLEMGQYAGDFKEPLEKLLLREGITDPFVRRVIDVECFLLSGLKAESTITAEIAFMVGERFKPDAMEYPAGGVVDLIEKMVRGIERKGGAVRCGAHVEEITVENGRATGVKLRKGELISADYVFSNASIWDTTRLLPDNTAEQWKTAAMNTPVVESFMHLHLAIRSNGIENIIGHHAVILDSEVDIAQPGNTVMISIPTVWSEAIAPAGWHIVHAYTLEPYDRWTSLKADRKTYEAAKRAAAEPLFAAIRSIIGDLDERLTDVDALVMIGSPITHERFNRRHKGTYGAGIIAGEMEFEWPNDIPVDNLKRCSDSTFPGIGVPAAAAAGLIAANELVGVRQQNEMVDRMFPREFDAVV